MIPAQLEQCRRVAESVMADLLYITGPSVTQSDPVTGELVTVPGEARYGTADEPAAGLVQSIGQTSQTEQLVGGQVLTLATYAVKVPATVNNVEPGDEVHVTDSQDSALDGLTLIVADPTAGNSFAVQRRLVCTLNSG